MRKTLKNGLVLAMVDLPIPILKHPKWLEVKYLPQLREMNLVKLLRQSLPEIENLTRKWKLRQIKVATHPSWTKPALIGFTRAVYYMTINSSSLAKIPCKNYPIVEIQNPKEIEDLIKGQFLYHSQRQPLYYTNDVNKSLEDFIKIIKKSLQDEKGFLLGAVVNKAAVGFLYGEFEKQEGIIDELFVEEGFRGKGVGRSLIGAAGQIFKEKGLTKVGLFVGTEIKSVGFYEKLGFEKEFVNWIKKLS
ncbi:MAG: GNAT family N-acetyltransferase [Patescibacteria group bacterium]